MLERQDLIKHSLRENDYTDLVAELYDGWFVDNPTKDSEAYRTFFFKKTGPILEIGSGTGRLLLHYLRQGFDIEGIDDSDAMLAICKRKAAKNKLKPVIHHQRMQDLSLDNRFATIIIPFATFMVLHRIEDVHEALKRFYDHLLPGGHLVFSMFIPHLSEEESRRRRWHLRRLAERADGSLAICNEVNTYDLIEQAKFGTYRYEIVKDGEVVSVQTSFQKFRWYGKYELSVMLEKAGFNDITATQNYQEVEIPHHHSALLFSAKR